MGHPDQEQKNLRSSEEKGKPRGFVEGGEAKKKRQWVLSRGDEAHQKKKKRETERDRHKEEQMQNSSGKKKKNRPLVSAGKSIPEGGGGCPIQKKKDRPNRKCSSPRGFRDKAAYNERKEKDRFQGGEKPSRGGEKKRDRSGARKDAGNSLTQKKE